MPQLALTVRVPQELARQLVASGLATERAPRRTVLPEIVITGLVSAATAITLMQGPETVKSLAHAIKGWLFSGDEDHAHDASPPVVVRAWSPRGFLELPVSPDTPVSEIVELLERTVFLRPESRDSHGESDV